MKRYLTFGALLLSLGIIALGAFLPRLAGAWMDDSSGKISYAPIKNVQLEFSHAGDPMPMDEKLALLSKYTDFMELPVSLATLSEKDILTIVQSTVESYQKAGLLPVGIRQLAKRDLRTQVVLFSWDATGNSGNIFWSVEFSPGTNMYMYLILDDQTGAVCSLSFSRDPYESNSAYTSPTNYLTQKQLQDKMTALCDLFADGLGWEDFDTAAIVQQAQYDGYFLHTSYSWNDILYGENRINIYVSDDNFSIG